MLERRATRNTPDIAETVERVVPRRQLLVEDGDVLIVPVASGLPSIAGWRPVHQLRVHGRGLLDEAFAELENAAAAGEHLARRHQVRLFFVESENDPPHLLEDFRTR